MLDEMVINQVATYFLDDISQAEKEFLAAKGF